MNDNFENERNNFFKRLQKTRNGSFTNNKRTKWDGAKKPHLYILQVKQVPNPSREDIEVLHSKYKEALLDLYIKYNPFYGDSSISLKIL